MRSTIYHLFPKHRCFLFLPSLLLCAFQASAAAPGDEHWDNQFGPVGANDSVLGVATIGTTVYIGGNFSAAGNTRAALVASYDGTNWHPMGNGMTSATGVAALAADGTNLYAVGGFDRADGVWVRSIARWDGDTWHPLGTGVSGTLSAVKIDGTNVYVGGLTSEAGGVPVNRIARWDGLAWSALGTGVAGGFLGIPIVAAIESDGTYVYAGGAFYSAGGVNATNIARWNGTSWSALGPGLNGSVNALHFHGGNLYAGGSFTNATLGITNLAVWNGVNWASIGSPGARVRTIASGNGDIYIGGDFTNVAGVSANRIARWDGANWSPLGTGLQGFVIEGSQLTVRDIAFDNSGRLYAAGTFNIAGDVGVSHVAGWNGTNWFALGGETSKGVTHLDRRVYTLLPVGTNLYAGGIFTEAGKVIVNGIARWNGSNWSSLGGGIQGTGSVFALAENSGLLYAGGSFSNIGGLPANNVAVWNGFNWSSMASGFNSNVYALRFFKGTLFAGGAFTARGDTSASLHGISQWDGLDWADVPLIESWRANNVINALVSDATNLYAGGNFFFGWGSPGGDNVNSIGRWDGTNWWSLGVGVGSNATVSALALQNGSLYVGGTFTNPSVASIQRVARWDGSAWTGLGAGFTNGRVLAVAATPALVYAAGTFTSSGGTSLNQIAKWDGTNWSGLGSGLTIGSPSGQALATMSNDVYVGGMFTFAGDKPAMFISRWNDQLNFYPPPYPELTRQNIATNGQFLFRLIGTSGETYVIQASTNLKAWVPVLTNTVVRYDFTDALAPSFPLRFYRAVLP